MAFSYRHAKAHGRGATPSKLRQAVYGAVEPPVIFFPSSPREKTMSKVLLTGASGFLGSRIARALSRAGHEVVCAGRQSVNSAHEACHRSLPADFTQDLQPDAWLPRLDGVDVVVNAVGILREHGRQTFDALHVQAPAALFEACAKAGVRRVVQVSALGADAQARSRYHLSKKKADDHLLQLLPNAVVVQPSLIYGPGGASARLFTQLASLPLIPLPGGGQQLVQPVHVDDAVQAIVALVESEAFAGQRVPLVGPQALALRDFLAVLRQGMGLGRPRFMRVPMALVGVGARLGECLPGSLLDRGTLQMLERGNTADPAATQRLLGRMPRPASDFIEPAHARATAVLGRLGWLLPPLRWSVAAVWIFTGIVSLGLYPVQDSLGLLVRVGVPAALAPLMLYGAALLDFAFGIATLALKGRARKGLWLVQIGLVLGYTAIITARMPEFWLHPFGPILKNLPMLALIALLYAFEEEEK
jgi:uncharacterized protein YbjT (DUF2867 family)